MALILKTYNSGALERRMEITNPQLLIRVNTQNPSDVRVFLRMTNIRRNGSILDTDLSFWRNSDGSPKPDSNGILYMTEQDMIAQFNPGVVGDYEFVGPVTVIIPPNVDYVELQDQAGNNYVEWTQNLIEEVVEGQ